MALMCLLSRQVGTKLNCTEVGKDTFPSMFRQCAMLNCALQTLSIVGLDQHLMPEFLTTAHYAQSLNATW